MRSILLLSLISVQSIFAQLFFEQGNGVVVTKNSTPLNLAWTGGLNAPQFSHTDLNYDGQTDIVIFDRDDNRLVPLVSNTYIGNNDRIYEYKPEYLSSFPKCKYWALMKDINNDGKTDLLTSSKGSIKYYKNTSVGTNTEYTLIDTLKAKRSGVDIKVYVNSVDIPAFEDVDFDGDIDILSFDVFGNTIEFNENISVNPDEMKFKVSDKCWGDFSENDLDNTVTLSDPDCLSQLKLKKQAKADPLHVGSTMAVYDLDNDNDYEIMLGDVSFNNIIKLDNSVNPSNNEYLMINQDVNFPSTSTPIDISIFPAVYFIDVNLDGNTDMLASPNTGNNTENKNSVWYYKNLGTSELPNFQFEKNNLFQDEMIDVGRQSKVRVFDYNQDGLMDILVAAGQIFNTTGTNSKISLYENDGTTTSPSFKHITDDFANLESLNLGEQLVPTFANLDGDNKMDMIVGQEDGTLIYFKNNSNSTNPYLFNANGSILDGIDVGSNATPVLFDIDEDGKTDLLIGNRFGKISYYKNTSSSNTPEFTLITTHFGNITIVNSSGLGFIDITVNIENGEPVIYAGSYKSGIKRINNIQGNLNGTFTITDENVNELDNIIQSSVAVYDFNDDGYEELLVANIKGGVEYFHGIDEANIGLNTPIKNKSLLYPNPSNSLIKITSPTEWSTINIYDISGQLVISKTFEEQLDISHLSSGSYILHLTNTNSKEIHKIIKK